MSAQRISDLAGMTEMLARARHGKHLSSAQIEKAASDVCDLIEQGSGRPFASLSERREAIAVVLQRLSLTAA